MSTFVRSRIFHLNPRQILAMISWPDGDSWKRKYGSDPSSELLPQNVRGGSRSKTIGLRKHERDTTSTHSSVLLTCLTTLTKSIRREFLEGQCGSAFIIFYFSSISLLRYKLDLSPMRFPLQNELWDLSEEERDSVAEHRFRRLLESDNLNLRIEETFQLVWPKKI